jgi:hypothetical protein
MWKHIVLSIGYEISLGVGAVLASFGGATETSTLPTKNNMQRAHLAPAVNRNREIQMLKKTPWLARCVVGIVASFAAGQCLLANAISFTGSSGTLAASVTFTTIATGVNTFDLQIALKNTSLVTPTSPPDVLTGLFFNFAGNPNLVPTTAAGAKAALVDVGSSVVQSNGIGNTTIYGAGQNVGSELAYRDQANLYLGARYGISAAGLGIFGGSDLLCTVGASNCAPSALNEGVGGAPPDGLAFGIVPAAFTGAGTNGGVTGRSLIDSTVIIRLSGLSGSTAGDLSHVFSNIWFTYGTAQGEGQFTVPEPSTLALLGLGAFALLALRRRRATSRFPG